MDEFIIRHRKSEKFGEDTRGWTMLYNEESDVIYADEWHIAAFRS